MEAISTGNTKRQRSSTHAHARTHARPLSGGGCWRIRRARCPPTWPLWTWKVAAPPRSCPASLVRLCVTAASSAGAAAPSSRSDRSVGKRLNSSLSGRLLVWNWMRRSGGKRKKEKKKIPRCVLGEGVRSTGCFARRQFLPVPPVRLAHAWCRRRVCSRRR